MNIPGESFTITASAAPDIEGCYLDTGYLLEEEVIYTQSGTDALGQVWVFAYAYDEAAPSKVSTAVFEGNNSEGREGPRAK